MARGKKKKKRGTTRKQRAVAKQKLANMTGAHLVEQAGGWIDRGDVRKGIEAYKQALKNGAEAAEVYPRLFHAYYLRFRELADKKMAAEARAVRDMGAGILKQVSCVDGEMLETAASFLAVGDTVPIYLEYLARNTPLPGVEKKIGSRLVVDNGLDLAEKFDHASLMNQDASMVAQARDAMDAGQWALAFKQMRRVSRQSPYSDIKAFAKAMIAFGRGDRASLQKSLEGMDEQFPLTSAVAVLKAWAKGETQDSSPKNSRTAGLLMGDTLRKHEYRKKLEHAVKREDVKAVIRWTKALSGLLNFKSRKTAIAGLLEIVGEGRSETGISLEGFFKIVKGALGRSAHMEVVFHKAMSRPIGFLSPATPEYLDALGVEFPDENDRNTALAVVIMQVIQSLETNQQLFWEREEELDDILYFFELPEDVIEEGEEEEVLFHLAQKAAKLDPGNKEAWDAILGTPEYSPSMRKLLVPCLEEMARIHEADHRPCLKLARLFYRKNAYRKAEKALAEAYERAPHDFVVKEEYALSFLVAAAGNLKRGKIDLAQRDLDKAQAFKVGGLKRFIAEKRLVATAAGGNGFSREGFDQLTQGFAAHEKLGVLLLFKLDAEDSDFKPPLNTRGVDTVFKTLKKQMGPLDSGQALELATPLTDTRAVLYKHSFFAQPLMGKRGQLLDAIGDEDFISLMVELAACGCQSQVVRQLAKRKKGKASGLTPVLAFCHAAFEYMDGQPAEAKKLDHMAGQADDRLKARLRKISKNLARIAPASLKPEFLSFDFSARPPWFYDMDDDDLDDYDDWGDDFDMDFGDVLEEICNRVMGTAAKAKKSKPPVEKKAGTQPPKADALPKLEVASFDPVSVFGKKGCNKGLEDAGEALARTAGAVVNGAPGMGAQLQQALETFMASVKKAGLVSTGEFREAGRRFASEYAPAEDILRAMDIHRISVGGMEAMHFIMGMRTGV